MPNCCLSSFKSKNSFTDLADVGAVRYRLPLVDEVVAAYELLLVEDEAETLFVRRRSRLFLPDKFELEEVDPVYPVSEVPFPSPECSSQVDATSTVLS